MRYLIAFLLPPLAVLLCGRPTQFVLNIILTLFLYVAGLVHALLVANSTMADERNNKLIMAITKTNKARAA